MPRPNGSKVMMVEGRHLRLAQTFRECHDAGVDDSECKIRIPSLQLTATGKIGDRRRLDVVGTRDHVIEEDEPGLRCQTTLAPVVELGEHEGRDDQVLVRFRQQPGTGFMIGIGRVEGG